MKIRLLEKVRISGMLYAKGVVFIAGRKLARDLIRRGLAELVSE